MLKQVRQAIRRAAPKAREKIGYGIPTFTFEGNLVHFAAFKAHIGFYPGPDAIVAFKKEFSAFEGAKGSVRFPFDEPLPLALVTRVTKFCVKQALARARQSTLTRPSPKLAGLARGRGKAGA